MRIGYACLALARSHLTRSQASMGKRGSAMAASAAAGAPPKRVCGMKFKDVITFFFRKADFRELSNFAPIPVTIRGFTYPTGEHCFHAGKYPSRNARRGRGAASRLPLHPSHFVLHFPMRAECAVADLHAASRTSDAGRAAELRERAKAFRKTGSVAADGLSAKRAGGKGKSGMALVPEELEGWLEAAEVLQREICLAKVAQPEVQGCLARSGSAYILHQDNRAVAGTPWGGKVKDLSKLLKAGRGIGSEDVVGENRLGHIWMDIFADVRNGLPNARSQEVAARA
ncbi:unnamed protein product [Prorocentrum cordatum]|uniref:Uncharacterized protein n=1 Tax=Prorocentrum cordatum TaxID=2364126 RepID=A0ABN9QKP7_9DINO|nr:unnamed protein product [Polarella glacialis]